MLISTMNDVPPVRAPSLDRRVQVPGRGRAQGKTKNLQLSREDVVNRMVAEAEARGGNAVLAMRFDTAEMGGNWTEICAYGTAVVIEPIE